MKTVLISLICFLTGGLLLQAGCDKKDPVLSASPCIRSMIKQIKAAPVRNPPAQVWKWETGGEVYYYLTSDCCDQYNYLYDEHCNIVCAPDGGFTGRGDGKCPDFQGEVKKVLVWKDDRKP